MAGECVAACASAAKALQFAACPLKDSIELVLLAVQQEPRKTLTSKVTMVNGWWLIVMNR